MNLLGILYVALSFATFNNLMKAYVKVNEGASEVLTLIIANVVSSVLILAYGVLTFLLLLCKTAVNSTVGFSYGFLTSSGANLTVLLLLCSVLMTGFNENVKNKFERDENQWGIEWSSFDTRAYQLTYIIGFICALGYTALFLVFMLVSRAMGNKAISIKVEE